MNRPRFWLAQQTQGTVRISLMTVSAGGLGVPAFCLIFAPLKRYDEPENLLSQATQFVSLALTPDTTDEAYSPKGVILRKRVSSTAES
jgi:hypothetical protein